MQVEPYLTFAGNCEEALKFYEQALGGKIAEVHRYGGSPMDNAQLPTEYKNMLHHLRLNPERRFWTDLAKPIGELTERKVLWAAAATLFYSLFSLTEGIGLIFRVSWAGWMAIGESAFFIPIEVYELMHSAPHEPGRAGHPITLLIVLGLNILIVWYLLQNRHRLFRHHHHD